MSEVVRYKGKIKKVDLDGLNQLEFLLCFVPNERRKEYEESYEDDVYNLVYQLNLEDTYVLIEDQVYEIVEKENKSTSYDIFDMVENSDGTYEYHVMYHNGGCDFDDAISTAFLNIEPLIKSQLKNTIDSDYLRYKIDSYLCSSLIHKEAITFYKDHLELIGIKSHFEGENHCVKKFASDCCAAFSEALADESNTIQDMENIESYIRTYVGVDNYEEFRKLGYSLNQMKG